MMEQLFQQTIEQFDIITIFRHENPDMDALGSQFGLYEWIKENYPSKQVYVCGTHFGNFNDSPIVTPVADEVISNSCAIIVDTANSARVDDQRFKCAKQTMQIDHHPHNETYASVELIDVEAAATCQILGSIFAALNDKVLSKETATYLYKGILTDTLCFKTSNTTSQTLLVASLLAAKGLEIAKLNRDVFDMDLKTSTFVTYLQGCFKYSQGFAYAMLSLDDVKPFDISINRARDFVSVVSNVKEYEIWCVFTQDDENPELYRGSIRSKVIPVSDTAMKYGGGGHKNACGIRNLKLEQVHDLIKDLKNLIK